jgi:flagellar basal-body rod protein FlgF
MDRALYVALSGAIATQRAQTANANNLANASSTGFRSELVTAQAINVDGPGFQSRVNSQLNETGWDSGQGAIIQTDRNLDVALRPDNWLAVQAPDGTEAYTKAGDLQIDVNGQLRTASGLAVLGDGGPLTIPPSSQISIGGDGTVSVLPQGAAGAATLAVVGRLKVVSGQPSQLQRREDGLFRATPGQTLQPAAGEVLNSGALEGSNVNLAGSLVTMIQLARQFELQVKVLRAVEDDATAANGLVKIS